MGYSHVLVRCYVVPQRRYSWALWKRECWQNQHGQVQVDHRLYVNGPLVKTVSLITFQARYLVYKQQKQLVDANGEEWGQMLSEEITDPKIGDPIELQESTFVHGFDVVEDCGGGWDEYDDEDACDG